MTKIYLASPFFNKKENEIKAKVLTHLSSQDVFVYDPQAPGNATSWEQSNNQWGKIVFEGDINAIADVDTIIAIDWGLYGDCGTAWEIGYAYAKGKRILVIVPDEKLNTPHSLMVANGCDNFVSLSRFLNTNDIRTLINNKDKPCFLAGVEQK